MYSTTKVEGTLRVGCLGLITVTVYSDGWWGVDLTTHEGVTYTRTRGTMGREGCVICYGTFEALELPEWMWDCINDKIEELKLTLERDGFNVPDERPMVV
jgi:hypothetical protein